MYAALTDADNDRIDKEGLALRLTVNGKAQTVAANEGDLLVDVLRDQLGLTGAKKSCGFQVCGACTVLVDSVPVSSCCYLAGDAVTAEVQTVEGFADEPLFADILEVFAKHNAFQCGYCAPGFVMTLKPLLEQGALRSFDDVVRELSGNVCRCTGYKPIVAAVCELAGIPTEDANH